MSDVRLSPPWITFANEITYTYGESPYVKVQILTPSDTGYILPIRVLDDSIAQALRNVLPSTQEFGNIIVTIQVFNSSRQLVEISKQLYTPKSLAETFCTALLYNRLFLGTVIVEPSQPTIGGNIAIVIKKRIVQFYNDDVSDLCRNFNEVAAKVFEQVSTLTYTPGLTVSFSTEDPTCAAQKNFYCTNFHPPKPCHCHYPKHLY